MNVITVSSEIRCEKPPEYDTVASLSPPSYDDAIKLNPSVFLAAPSHAAPSSSATTTTAIRVPDDSAENYKEEESSSSVFSSSNINSSRSISHIPSTPPVYTITTAMPNEVVTYDNERCERSDQRRNSGSAAAAVGVHR